MCSVTIADVFSYKEFKVLKKSTKQIFKITYPHISHKFTDAYFQWRYEKCFGDEAIFICLFKEEQLIGQAVIFVQKIIRKNTTLKIAQLADLIVHPECRSFLSVNTIYKALKNQINENNFDLVFTLPNSKSIKINHRFLRLELAKPLQTFLSFTFPFSLRKSNNEIICTKYTGDLPKEILSFFENSHDIFWDKSTLEKRLDDPHHKFGFVHNNNTLMIVSPRRIKGIKCLVIFAVFKKSKSKICKTEWRQMKKAAAHYYKIPFLLYLGRNTLLPISHGLKLSYFIKSAEKSVQVLKLNDTSDFVDFDRLELLDLDIL